MNVFQTRLFDFIEIYHRQMMTDKDALKQFIVERADAASTDFENACHQGYNYFEAMEIANQTLYRGVGFLKVIETLKVPVNWNGNYYSAGTAEINGLVLANHKTLDGVKAEFESILKSHIESSVDNGDYIPYYIQEGDFEIEYKMVQTVFFHRISIFLLIRMNNYFRETLRKTGRKSIIPIKENNKPPIVPAANGNQNGSFVDPIINGLKPSTVDVIVSIIGRILKLQAFTYACSLDIPFCFIIRLNSSMM